jgi:DMSO/TMAO reductase YedYZ molybdopterin-dependent catalytic subunit
MKRIFTTSALILFFLFFAACSASLEESAESAPTDVDSAETTVSGSVLEIQGLEESKSLTMADLQVMTATEGWGGTISSAGVISPPQQLKGVPITYLASLVGGLEPGMGVSIVAKDGYAMTMSYEQIVEGDFITYDPGTGNENSVEGPLKVIVAYARDGEPISADDDGPLRLFIVSDKNDNIVDGHWTVKWVTQIRLKPMSEEWSLYLEGALTEEMDRNSFESCSAPGCHQATWTDEDGNEWTGVPLYYLAGRVDGGNIHEDRAFDDGFAEAGYVLQLFAADGYNVGIESERTIFNRDLFVASLVNGEPLDEKNFPLRLVGKGLDKSEMIGQLAQIVIQPNEGVAMPSDEIPVEEVTEEPEEMVLPEGAALMIFGEVMNKLTLGMENLQAMNVVDLEAEHPKKGLQSYQGIRLNDLLNLTGADADASILVVTASDGYKSEISLADIGNCTDCLLAFDDDGSLSMVMPGLESNFWVKRVNFLEVK